MATSTRTRTSVRTRVVVALASGAVLAAAVAGVYQVDKKSFTKESAPRQEVVREVQATKFDLRGSASSLYTASISFNTSVDIPPKANIIVLMPPGLSVDDSTVTVDGSLIGEYFLSKQGRVLVINRDGNGETISRGRSIEMLVGRIAVSDSEAFTPSGTPVVAVQYMVPEDRLPDFTIADMYLEGSTVTFILQNKGIESREKNMEIRIESNGDLNRTYIARDLADHRFLNTEGFSKLQPGMISETTSFYICIDSNNLVEEIDETNNCYRKKLNPRDSVSRDEKDLPESVKKPAGSTPVMTDKTVSGEKPQDEALPELKADSDSDGDIATTGVLEIIEPNGGEVVTAGDRISIRWRGNGDRVKNVALSLMDGDDQLMTIVEGIATDDKTYTWLIPEGVAVSKARIRIAGYDINTELTTEDSSDRWFEIAGRVSVSDSSVDTMKPVIEYDTDSKSTTVTTPTSTPTSTTADTGTSTVAGTETDAVLRGGDVGSSDVGTDEESMASTVGFNNLIKLECPIAAAYDVNHPCRTVYYYSSFGTRHAFPHSKIFFTWYDGFDNIQIISKDTMASIPLGRNVTYRPGVRMVKFQTTDIVYAVSRGGILRAIDTEQLANQLYGVAWSTMIDDMNDAFYADYAFSAPIISVNDFNVTAEVESSLSINDSL